MNLYVLWHEYYVPEDNYDVETELGIYSTYKNAQDALKKFRSNPRFRDHPDDFQIAEIEVDLDGWQEGFVSF